ncbi:MAG: hypothetical protein ABIY51_08355 [Ferruginibacter sp.]
MWKYSGLALQFLIAIGIAVYAGLKIDAYFNFSTALAVWILPLLVITGMIVKIVKDTAPKK